MKKRFNTISALALALCGVAIGVVVTYTSLSIYVNYYTDVYSKNSSYEDKTGKLTQIFSILDNYFVEDIDDDALVDAAASGMVSGTGDRWSYYISADGMQAYEEQLNNSYVGVGITISSNEQAEDGFIVMQVSDGGPAQKAGVRVEDVLTQVNGEAVVELGLEATKADVRGEAGTEVTLAFRRGTDSYTVTIKRASIDMVVATGKLLDDNIGLITIENFDIGCADRTKEIITEMIQQGAQSLVFDVRNNPGGLRSELSELLDYLLPEGVVFQSVAYDGQTSVDYSDAACLQIPMVVLVNENSYSAAEYFAACLQEYGAAEVVGTQTCGKGYYQQMLPLSDGSAVSISTGAYFTPQGKSLANVGITPDVQVDMSSEDLSSLLYDTLQPENDVQLQAALQLLK